MATNFPTSLDTLTNPTSGDPLNNPSHSAQHANANDAIEALEAKVGVDDSAVTSSHSYKIKALEDNSISKTIVATKGDLIVASANDTVTILPAGTNGYQLVVDSAQTSGLKWDLISVTADNSVTLTNKTLTGPLVNSGILKAPEETWNVSATAATGTVNVDILTSAAWYYTSNASANWTLNFRGNSGTTLASLLSTGDAITVVFASAIGATQYRPTTFQIDGNAVTPKWQGGTAPTTGNASSTDIYSFTIIKTAATPTYVVFASQTKFGA